MSSELTKPCPACKAWQEAKGWNCPRHPRRFPEASASDHGSQSADGDAATLAKPVVKEPTTIDEVFDFIQKPLSGNPEQDIEAARQFLAGDISSSAVESACPDCLNTPGKLYTTSGVDGRTYIKDCPTCNGTGKVQKINIIEFQSTPPGPNPFYQPDTDRGKNHCGACHGSSKKLGPVKGGCWCCMEEHLGREIDDILYFFTPDPEAHEENKKDGLNSLSQVEAKVSIQRLISKSVRKELRRADDYARTIGDLYMTDNGSQLHDYFLSRELKWRQDHE